MKTLFYCFFALSLFLACTPSNQNKFSLTGQTQNITDGTKFYLVDAFRETLIDSAVISNNQFQFNTQLPESPFEAYFYSSDFKHRKMIWLEDKKMELVQTSEDFKQSKVTGSETNLLNDVFYEEIRSVKSDSAYHATSQALIRKYPNSILSACMLHIMSTSWGQTKTGELFNLLSEENQKSRYAPKIEQYLTMGDKPKVGDQYIDVQIPDSTGQIQSLSDNLGKVTLLEFWHSKCRGCRLTMPGLVKSYNQYHSKGFNIYAISVDADKADWIRAIKRFNFDAVHVLCSERRSDEAGLAYHVSRHPQNYIINENGVIIAENVYDEELDELLSSLFNQQEVSTAL